MSRQEGTKCGPLEPSVGTLDVILIPAIMFIGTLVVLAVKAIRRVRRVFR